MGASTLSLKPSATESKGPDFDPSKHYGEVGGMDTARYIQGKYLYNNAKQCMGKAPEHMWLEALTPEQEKKRREQEVRNKQFLGGAQKPRINEGAIPQTVINAERENAQARAVEARAE